VDALVESQDWWLRDQASLAMGFDNWMSGDPNNGNSSLNMNGSGTMGDIDSMAGLETGYYIPSSIRGSTGSPDDDWNGYT
jgi:hypothetical protein